MVTVEVVGWKKDFAEFTGWGAHRRSELRRRLRRAVRGSKAHIKCLAAQLDDRQLVCISSVDEEELHGLTQILHATGAEFRISLEDSNDPRLFKRVPRR